MLNALIKIVASAALISGLALSGANAQALPKSSFISVGASTSVPFGWVDFCDRYQDQCPAETSSLDKHDIEMTGANWALINKINKTVNSAITPVSDQEHWGVIDQWDIPLDGRGDCEDYALMKRKMLADAGLPIEALLISVVRDEANEGHAVLTVKTSRGEFVLDNMTNDVKAWTATGYRFVKRQSQENANIWVALSDPRTPASVATTR